MDFYAQSAFGPEDTPVSRFNRMLIDSNLRWMFGMVAGAKYQQLDKTHRKTTF
ncbi:hypothetical protein E8E12_004634 [Didymella heteroderae]|uniref:Uncharacterized protein n=1 Tax=Didymella heteroderae TaxID=1769908 RepID=A0A9P5BYB0_9PLEO|nr:hypothetical protein E8E12_004634 [Didymella heteroderae]